MFLFSHFHICHFYFVFYSTHTALTPLFLYKLFTTWSIFLNPNNSRTARKTIFIFAFSSRSHSRLTAFVAAHSVESRQRYKWWYCVTQLSSMIKDITFFNRQETSNTRSVPSTSLNVIRRNYHCKLLDKVLIHMWQKSASTNSLSREYAVK